ncbi:hypothetical protein A3860_23645 [Niastella vici]|uniref:TonB-dependent receptor plug domain-containing protein n=1 Tax=Niastella vici TaxID=1703345 RepID=A0A1V9FZX8_9BACT|nr:SusC/RagA family TonB-linked outer membrane protein [Niastella vici]OQP63925.1 hypothetical protein A3860_23645 [Niastella vici]
MMKLTKMLLSIVGVLSLLIIPGLSVAQEAVRIRGKVIDSKDKKPLSGVTIQEVKGTQKTISELNGYFQLNTKLKQELTFTMVGYDAKTVIADGTEVIVELEKTATTLEDVIVIGYGTQKKELLSGSVVTMKMDDVRRTSPTTSLGNLLAGQMAGVRVGTPAGAPGTAPSITVRTKSSINGQDVLFVIDGMVTSSADDFNNLSPNDIETLTVLKDAASTAAYGARASGGVIVVTTRRGKNGKPRINYSFNTGVDKRGKNAPLTSAIETGEIYNRINPTSSTLWSQSDFDYFKNINNGWGYNQLDAVWQDPYTKSHNISITGGGEKIKYFVGGSYVKQGAFMKNLTYDKYNFRANLTADLTRDLTLFAGLSLNNNKTYTPTNTSVGDVNGIYRKQLLWQPEQPVWTDGGNPIDYGWIGNVGAEVRGDGGYIKNNYVKPVVNLQATYKIPVIPGLSASTQYIKAYTANRNKTFGKRYDMWVMKTTGVRQISTNDADLVTLKKSSQIGKDFLEETNRWNEDYQLNFQLNYERTFANVHHVKGWLTYERAEGRSGGFTGGRENFPVYTTDQWWATSGDRLDSYVSGSTEQTIGRKSWVGQFFYDYDNKYIANFTYRYDGSYKFPQDKRWGFFPSGSLGWIISKENFFNSVRGVELLKLRASAGLTSADNISAFQYQQSYVTGNSAYFGTSPVTNVGVTYGSIVNPDITWEKSFNYNVAVDVNFLEHFNATADYFFVRTYDILTGRVAVVPPTFSRSLPSSNYGEVQSKGVELSLGYKNFVGDVNYYINMNAAYAAAKLIRQDKNITYPWQKDEGNSMTRITSYVTTGMLRTQADVDAFITANPNYKFNGIAPAAGQLTYADLSGKDGKPDGVIDSWDVTTVKKNNNPVVLGLNLGVEWKGFTIDASFSGSLHQWRMVNNLVSGNVEWNRMWRKWYTDAWTPNTPNATLPIRYSANDGTQSVTNTASTFWLKSSNFIRMRLLNIGYSIPAGIIHKAGLNGLRMYFSGSNLFLISKFNKDYFDPEIGDGFSYPTMKTYNFGFNVTL